MREHPFSSADNLLPLPVFVVEEGLHRWGQFSSKQHGLHNLADAIPSYRQPQWVDFGATLFALVKIHVQRRLGDLKVVSHSFVGFTLPTSTIIQEPKERFLTQRELGSGNFLLYRVERHDFFFLAMPVMGRQSRIPRILEV